MQNLINELRSSKRTATGVIKGPSALEVRAAKAIEQLMGINNTNNLVIKTMQKDAETSYYTSYHSASTVPHDPGETDSTKVPLFE